MITSRATSLAFAAVALAAAIFGEATGYAAPSAADPASPAGRRGADLAGTWELSVDGTGETCRVLLRPQRSGQSSTYVLGLPPACRHSLPEFAKAGGWSLPDPTHLALTDSAGAPIVVLAAAGDGFTARLGERAYTLKAIAATGRSAAGFAPIDALSSPGFATIVPVSKRLRTASAAQDVPSDLGGRYAVMREKRDTGCMVTLDDTSRVKGGARAQLAPGCRDQGIVIFDPTAWQVVKGELVLTARAGHKARLLKAGEGSWQKDTTDGSKPLGLKKL